MSLDPALILQLLGIHPARRLDFDRLRAGLLHGVEGKLINVSRNGDLELFSYSSACQFGQQWDIFSLIARGLVLDPAERRVIATPFPKFFNFNEGGMALPDEPFEATEKIDGSLGIIFHHRGAWRITTRGQLLSPQGRWATQYLHANLDPAALDIGSTYLAEIVYPENRIVIPYEFEGLVLLGAYDEKGNELPRTKIEETASRARMRVAGSLAHGSFDELFAAAEKLGIHEEGFVVRFASGLRIKIKGEAYCRIHKLICRCTPLALWESMMNCENLGAIRRDLPEEMRSDFDSIRRLLDAKTQAALDEIRSGHDRLLPLSDREIGLMSQRGESGLTEMQRKFIFACRNRQFLERVREKGEWREKLFKTIRPDGNRLAGYAPSSAMNRFAEDGAG